MGTLLRPTDAPDDAARSRQHDPGSLVVSLTPVTTLPVAEVRVVVADPALQARIEGHLLAALASARQAPAPVRVWKLSTTRRAHALGPRLAGSLVVIRALPERPGRLSRLVALAEGYGAAGIQLACAPPLPARLEKAVFHLLESRRGRPGLTPLLVAPSDAPVEVLRRTIEARGAG